MNFGDIIEHLLVGGRARREDWPDKETYIIFKEDKLCIFNTDDKVLHPLFVSEGDLAGTDWEYAGNVIKMKTN